ncbi:MAG: CDP-glycerol--glycerophosphate glycerophosphotransferase [Eubacterium sp.]|nr:CDP-glycerol--glycerophosphate glycerophosphotransferase [Eubacterium sp.]
MNKLLSSFYPMLQRARFFKFISLFNKAKRAPLEENKILMFTTSRGKLGGNLIAIKNYIENNNIPCKVTAFTSVDMPDDKAVAYEMATSKFILVDDFEPIVYVLKLRENQHLVQVWHAMGAFKKFGYSRKSAEKNSLTHKNYTEAIVSSPEISAVYAQAFGIDESRIKPVGVPRTDMLFDEDYKAKTIARLYEKEPRLKDKKICLFAPTFRGSNVNDAYYPNDFLHIEKLLNELGDDWAVIVKYHPFIKNPPEIPESVKNSVFDFGDEREINDILFITDVLVTDYSSVIFENAILNNPLVLYAPDLEEYDGERGFYFEYNAYSCGQIVKRESDLAAAIRNAGSNNEKMEEFRKRFVSLCDGNSCRRFAEEILKAKS